MKQKILSAILTSAVILSMTGCGGAQPTEIPNSKPSQESEITASTTTSTTTKKQEQTTTAAATTTTAKTTTTAPEEVSKPVEILKVNNSYGITNGTWSFKADNGEGYYYDISNNKLIKNESGHFMTSSRFLIGDLICLENSIIDPKTGETVLPTDGCKLKDVNKKSGLILVSKLDEGFSGNTFSLGVMNSSLEWVYPLTEITVDGMSTGALDYKGYNLVGNYAVTSGGYSSSFAYSFKENKIAEIPEIGDLIGENSGADKFVFSNSNHGKRYVFDSSTGKATEIVGNYLRTRVAGDGIAVMDYDSKKWSVLSWNDYKDMGFDLSEYDVDYIYAATENYIAFIAKNPDGAYYTIIMKKDGSFVVDPIKGASRRDYYTYIYGDYVINTDYNYIVNCKTSEMKTYSNENLSLVGFDSTSGKLIMCSNGNYYLADITDPETLINPFEIAEIQ